MLKHQIDQLVVRPLRIVELQFIVRRALAAKQITGRDPMDLSRPTSSSRVGGVFRYSITVGSTPLFRIMPNVLRELPQSGL
jgi:hypothetical protein